MRIGSLCSGISGLDMGVSAATGAHTAWFCEREPAPVRVLNRHYPGVPVYADLKTTDWDAVEPVDIITAGYPCQPFSMAGQRKGTDDERHLWPYVADCIRRVGPRYVFLENVRGHLTLGFDRVLGDLADLGFDANWAVLRASDVGAPHRRERIFIVAAHATNLGHERGWGTRGRRHGPAHRAVDAAHADGHGLEGQGGTEQEVARHERRGGEPAADTRGISLGTEPQCVGRRGDPLVTGLDAPPLGRYDAAVRRWEQHHRNRPAPSGRRTTQPPFRRVDDGLPGRMGDRADVGGRRSTTRPPFPDASPQGTRQRCRAPGGRARMAGAGGMTDPLADLLKPSGPELHREFIEAVAQALAASPGCLARTSGGVPSTKGGIDLDGRPLRRQEDWQQGVSVIRFEPGDGRFSYEQVAIHDGWALRNGKEYRG